LAALIFFYEYKFITILATTSANLGTFSADLVDLAQGCTDILIISDALTTLLHVGVKLYEAVVVQAFCKGLSWDKCEHKCEHKCKRFDVESDHYILGD
jgi:hypothetical protein